MLSRFDGEEAVIDFILSTFTLFWYQGRLQFLRFYPALEYEMNHKYHHPEHQRYDGIKKGDAYGNGKTSGRKQAE
jgi:hypothetical protein